MDKSLLLIILIPLGFIISAALSVFIINLAKDSAKFKDSEQ